MLPFTVSFQDGVPVSDQILQAVRKAILTGQLAGGDAFPSVRALSQELRISPTTAHKVVAQLKTAGYLASRPGIGMVITGDALPSRDQRLEQLQPRCLDLLKEAAALNLDFPDAMEALKQAAEKDDSLPQPGRKATQR